MNKCTTCLRLIVNQIVVVIRDFKTSDIKKVYVFVIVLLLSYL